MQGLDSALPQNRGQDPHPFLIRYCNGSYPKIGSFSLLVGAVAGRVCLGTPGVGRVSLGKAGIGSFKVGSFSVGGLARAGGRWVLLELCKRIVNVCILTS